jgi:SAM-dependent methyltransferase
MGEKKSRHKEGRKAGKSRHRHKPRKADILDRHALYEQSVQATDFEYEFIDGNFRRMRGRDARRLREDFCGTAQMCCEWVRGRADNEAIGVDLDPDVLGWGREHHVAALTPAQQERVTLLQEDVLKVKTDPADIILAMNFSWQTFRERETLRKYFRAVRRSLGDDGVFFLDIFGGSDAYRELREKTRHKGFTYVWDQASFDPVTAHMLCHIHFHFDDGSKMKQAFTYEWRLWTLPEVKEMLLEAGFTNVTIYWQGTDEDGEPDGVFLPAEKGDADPAWICMISAEK